MKTSLKVYLNKLQDRCKIIFILALTLNDININSQSCFFFHRPVESRRSCTQKTSEAVMRNAVTSDAGSKSPGNHRSPAGRGPKRADEGDEEEEQCSYKCALKNLFTHTRSQARTNVCALWTPCRCSCAFTEEQQEHPSWSIRGCGGQIELKPY